MAFRLFLAFALLSVVPPQRAPQGDAVTALVVRLEETLRSVDKPALAALATDAAAIDDLAGSMREDRPTRLIVKERDRAQTATGQRLLIEVFAEYGGEGGLTTWNLELQQGTGGVRIASATRLASVNGLYRLALNAAKPYTIRNLTVRGPDLALHIPTGTAFVAETGEGPTAVVLLGNGEMRFSPPDPAEQTQVRIFSGSTAMRTAFDAAFLRVKPSDFATLFPEGTMIERAPAEADVRRARDVFNEYVGKTLQIDLTDLSSERWWITPQAGDMVAEIRTRGLGSLTYTRSGGDHEDISLFERRRRRIIAVYASAEKLARRGRFYSEDDLLDYDVLAYDIDATVSPDRAFIEGNARIKIRIKSSSLATLNLRLAESLAVRGVFSPNVGRLLHLRVVGQNSLIVNLPAVASSGTELWLNVLYAGRVQPQELEREAIAVSQDAQDPIVIPLEPRLLYSHRAYWYPQSTVSDYATVRLSITAPAAYDIVATGAPIGTPVPPPGVAGPGQGPRRMFVFESDRPVRYLAFVATRLRPVDTREVEGVSLIVQANARQAARARSIAARTEDIFRFYRSLVGSAPYPALSVVVTEREVPGGHSPAFFAVVDQVQLTSGITWRNDPVNFESYPEFILAHEIAHQWWGQAVGWKNYHEQWLSEGFAQYFAALYAEKKLQPGVMGSVVRQMRQTAINASPQGPVYLGYRLGHIKGDTRVFRSIIYNKAAMVLHMLRRLVGDDAFFTGVSDFYATWRFRKAGTDDFMAAMEKASGTSLARFFDTWVFGESIPRVKFSHVIEGNDAIVRFEQQSDPTDFPVTVTLTYASGASADVTIPVTEKIVEKRLPLKGRVRSVTANADNGSLAVIVR
ncbi:MAG TPA: M1 family aminopeptidase [Vicinamibacterales bacterium]|nr:M1 family aminopeptidase [Vicinamibacterales bacterium]